jgi:hypothetical protein
MWNERIIARLFLWTPIPPKCWISAVIGTMERLVRCYFMRKDHIEGYALLHDGPDQDLIEEAKAKFREVDKDRYDGFEVWRRDRCLYRSTPLDGDPSSRGSPAASVPSQERRP